MSTIRVSDLARGLGVNSDSVLNCLPSLGIKNQMFPSSLLNDNQANRVREYFHKLGGSLVPSRPQQSKQAIPASSEANEKLVSILAQSPDDLRAAWAPALVPRRPLSNDEFIQTFSRIWFDFKLERYGCTLNARQHSLVHGTLKPNELGHRKRLPGRSLYTGHCIDY